MQEDYEKSWKEDKAFHADTYLHLFRKVVDQFTLLLDQFQNLNQPEESDNFVHLTDSSNSN